MNAIDLDSVCRIVLKARVFNAMEGSVNPEDSSNALDDEQHDILDDDGDDATEDELRTFIDDLNDDQQIELVALTWVGRGSFSRAEWRDALAEARAASNGRTSDYLLGMPLLADYLEEGLAAFDLSCADSDMVD